MNIKIASKNGLNIQIKKVVKNSIEIIKTLRNLEINRWDSKINIIFEENFIINIFNVI